MALAKRRHRKLGIAWRLPILLFVRELPSWLDQSDPPDLADVLHRGKAPELPGMATWLATEPLAAARSCSMASMKSATSRFGKRWCAGSMPSGCATTAVSSC